MTDVVLNPPETVKLADLTPHERNYRGHPDDQVEHIMESMREHGVYRNVVIAQDGTILAGHGVVEAATKLGMDEITVIRLNVAPDDPRALKVLTGDNEMSRRADVDDRLLTELLREINDVDSLLGTGYDEQMLANLALVTRPSSEIANFDAAAEWAGAGMPAYDQDGTENAPRLMLRFDSDEDREKVLKLLGIESTTKRGILVAAWWPPRARNDVKSVKFETEPQA